MNENLLRKLKTWRDETAKKEMVEGFRVLPNRSIEDIARMEPKTREELTSIKGIKDKKYYKYGKEILSMVKESVLNNKANSKQPFFENAKDKINSQLQLNNFYPETEISEDERRLGLEISNNKLSNLNLSANNQKEKIYSVSEFLDRLNEKLISEEARLKGEITSVDEREKVVYFNLKDKEDGSIINCLMFRYQYEISGIKLKIGNEIIASGYPEIYKPMGKFSFKTNLVEIAGEGALKKAYDELKNKLEKEGLFSLERKKSLPELPETIGLITSSSGAAMGDFMMNLGSFGFKIKFINSSVEGKQAVFDLISAVKSFGKMKGVDILVIIRGGGSLESLQAFNNEILVREIAKLKIPVVCGVGHEKDISLVSLASDVAVSTPTAAARAVRESWEKAVEKLSRNESVIANAFEKYLYELKNKLEKLSYNLSNEFENILLSFSNANNNFLKTFESINFAISNAKRAVDNFSSQILANYNQNIINAKNKIKFFENAITANNPERQLKLGYSIVSLENKIIRSVKQVKKGDILSIKISDGKIESEAKRVLGE
jgi:exodeoxyribonuclease VII large subunit